MIDLKCLNINFQICNLCFLLMNCFCILFILIFQVETSKVLLKETGVNLMLTVVDTPGFGDAVDNSQW